MPNLVEPENHTLGLLSAKITKGKQMEQRFKANMVAFRENPENHENRPSECQIFLVVYW